MQKSHKCKYILYGKEQQKKRYTRPEDAMDAARLVNESNAKMHIFTAYKCTTCLRFHIGRSHKLNPNWVGNSMYDNSKTNEHN